MSRDAKGHLAGFLVALIALVFGAAGAYARPSYTSLALVQER
jgi:hypothetical protein